VTDTVDGVLYCS